MHSWMRASVKPVAFTQRKVGRRVVAVATERGDTGRGAGMARHAVPLAVVAGVAGEPAAGASARRGAVGGRHARVAARAAVEHRRREVDLAAVAHEAVAVAEARVAGADGAGAPGADGGGVGRGAREPAAAAVGGGGVGVGLAAVGRATASQLPKPAVQAPSEHAAERQTPMALA